MVDITNYVMLEYGQPMHAFDADCLEGKALIVRRAKDNEPAKTLDDKDHTLSSNMLVIADATKPACIAGVMGCQNSEIKDTTKVVVFESANFSGPATRQTAKTLGVRTDSSALFEKGLDATATKKALLRACELVELLDAGDVVDGMIDIDNADYAPVTLPLETDRINALLGLSLTADEMIVLLARLDITVENNIITVPSFRGDILCMADVAEEVARIYGYDKIPTTLYAGGMVQGALTSRQKFDSLAGRTARALGFDEVMTHSFISTKLYDKICLPQDSTRRLSTTIMNPLGEDFSVMRTTALPSLLESLAHNYNVRNAKACLFELGTIYTPQCENGVVRKDVQPTEEKMLTLGAYGGMDFYDMKGCLETILKTLSIGNVSFEKEPSNSAYHPGRCATILIDGKPAGVLGVLHPTVCKNFDMDQVSVVAAELSMNVLFQNVKESDTYQSLPKFPSSARDLAILCDRSIPVLQLEQCMRGAIGDLLESIELFDVFTGAQVAADKKSVAYSLILRAADHTLTVEECDVAINKALKALEKEFDAKLRS